MRRHYVVPYGVSSHIRILNWIEIDMRTKIGTKSMVKPTHKCWSLFL